MRANPVAFIWLLAGLAALTAYSFGATYTLAAAWAFVADAAEWMDRLVLRLPYAAADLIPALAIGALVAFVPLAILSIRAGRRGRLALVLVPSIFLWLAGRDATRADWLEALLVAGIGALVMTGRLRHRAAVALRTG